MQNPRMAVKHKESKVKFAKGKYCGLQTTLNQFDLTPTHSGCVVEGEYEVRIK